MGIEPTYLALQASALSQLGYWRRVSAVVGLSRDHHGAENSVSAPLLIFDAALALLFVEQDDDAAIFDDARHNLLLT